MKIDLVSRGTGRTCKLTPKNFGKLLHLARFHGWRPERAPGEWPSTSWNTEIILPHVGAYMAGTVLEADARGLAEAVLRVIDSESSGLDQALYFAALGVLEVAKDGEFEVRLEPSAE